MFTHWRTKEKYYSVNEKLNYYKKIINDNKNRGTALYDHAKKRIEELSKIKNQSYSIPRIIVTNDKHFGNTQSKPRMCVAIKEDDKGRILAAPMHKRTTNIIVFDKNTNRQISNNSDGHNKWIDKAEVYESKYVDENMYLTEYDIEKIKEIYK